MNIRKTGEYIADVERQFEWYASNAGLNVAERYLAAVESVSHLLGQHPHLGPRGGFTNPKLSTWRFFPVSKPFNQHIVFYEVLPEQVILRRTMHGHRDLPRRLLD